MAVKNIDTTTAALWPILDEAAKATGETFHAGSSMKLAFVRFVISACEGADLKNPEDRAKIGNQIMATPGWFGCGNNSACRQARENKKQAALDKAYKF